MLETQFDTQPLTYRPPVEEVQRDGGSIRSKESVHPAPEVIIHGSVWN